MMNTDRNLSWSVAITNQRAIEYAFGDATANELGKIVTAKLAVLCGVGWGCVATSNGMIAHYSGEMSDLCAEVTLNGALISVALTPISVGDARLVPSLRVRSLRDASCDSSEEQIGASFGRKNYRNGMAAAAELLDACNEDRLLFHFQSVLNPRTGAILYNEALSRVQASDGAVSSAGQRISSLELLGMSRPFDVEIVGRAIDVLGNDHSALIGVNISAQSAVRDIWWVAVLAKLRACPDLARRLTIEITETAKIEDETAARDFISALQCLGVRVAIDDFGGGGTSLRFALSSGVDIIKIDRSLLDSKRYPAHVLPAILFVVGSFVEFVVVEGVETAEEYERADEAGGMWYQGYLFGVPSREYGVGRALSAQSRSRDQPKPQAGVHLGLARAEHVQVGGRRSRWAGKKRSGIQPGNAH